MSPARPRRRDAPRMPSAPRVRNSARRSLLRGRPGRVSARSRASSASRASGSIRSSAGSKPQPAWPGLQKAVERLGLRPLARPLHPVPGGASQTCEPAAHIALADGGDFHGSNVIALAYGKCGNAYYYERRWFRFSWPLRSRSPSSSRAVAGKATVATQPRGPVRSRHRPRAWSGHRPEGGRAACDRSSVQRPLPRPPAQIAPSTRSRGLGRPTFQRVSRFPRGWC
jgi:hypothetical protein